MVLKMADRPCLCCGQTKSKYYGIYSKKSQLENVISNIQLLFRNPIDFKSISTSVICDKCLTVTSKLPDIKSRILSAINNNVNKTEATPDQKSNKRLPSTPAEELRQKLTPSSSRQSVISSLVHSFEKLKTPSSVKERTGVSRRRIDFNADHSYSQYDQVPVWHDPDEDEKEISSILLESEDCHKDISCAEIGNQLTQLANSKTFLLKYDTRMLQDPDLFSCSIREMYHNCKGLLQILVHALGSHESTQRRVATIATIYGIILHSQNNKSSGIQKIYSSLLIRYHADNKLMHRLNQVHMTMSDSTKSHMIDKFGGQLEEKLIKDLSEGKNGKLNGDNLDIRVNTNDIRMKNKNRDYHFFASNFVLNRISIEKQLTTSNPAQQEPKLEIFLPNADEIKIYQSSLKTLLGRVLVTYVPGFQWMKKLIPDHIDHIYRDEMKKKSNIHMLPLSLNNECSYEGCLHILDEYVDMVNRWYRRAGRGKFAPSKAEELETLQIPVGGDQLTRVRFQGAKGLRAGAHTRQERFDQLFPMVIELFHTLQDFLEKLCKKFLKLGSSRDQGTLANLKVLIQRSNVNGKVKSRFKAHEDFVQTVGHAYFLDYVMSKFHMETLESTPVHPAIPDNIRLLHAKSKTEIFNTIMDEIVTEIFIPFEMQKPKMVNLNVIVANQVYELSSLVENDTATVPLLINNKEISIRLPISQAKKGCCVVVDNVRIFVREVNKGQDDLFNYVNNFLQWYFVILQLDDAIHEGDITRTNIILKQMIPFFYSHSVLSKYLTECIDFILKTEFVLPENVALQVRAASFVNVFGGEGQNKAADMHKENEVKLIKDLIRGLGSNKTEKSIVAISKAAPVISVIADNFDKMLNIPESRSRHKKRSSAEDISEIVSKLRNLDIWKFQGNRTLTGFQGITCSPFDFDKDLFLRTVKSTVFRLQRDLPCEYDDEKDDENDLDMSDEDI